MRDSEVVSFLPGHDLSTSRIVIENKVFGRSVSRVYNHPASIGGGGGRFSAPSSLELNRKAISNDFLPRKDRFDVFLPPFVVDLRLLHVRVCACVLGCVSV